MKKYLYDDQAFSDKSEPEPVPVEATAAPVEETAAKPEAEAPTTTETKPATEEVATYSKAQLEAFKRELERMGSHQVLQLLPTFFPDPAK